MTRKLAAIVAGAALVAVGFTAGVAAQGKGKEIVRWAQADLKWEAVPNMPVSTAKAWSHANGSYCQFTKFPKGTKVPLHSHSADIGSVVVAGQFGSAVEGAVKLAGAGAYHMIPGGLKHTTECGADADCVIYSCGPAPFDLVPAAPKK